MSLMENGEFSIEELNNYITTYGSQIESAKDEKEEYNRVVSQLEVTNQYLTKAIVATRVAQGEIQEGYTGNGAKTLNTEIEEEINAIKGIQESVTQAIESCNSKISLLNNNIQNWTIQLNGYKRKLREIEE